MVGPPLFPEDIPEGSVSSVAQEGGRDETKPCSSMNNTHFFTQNMSIKRVRLVHGSEFTIVSR